MNADSLAHARFLVRRLRRRLPRTKIVLGFWTFTPEDMARRDPVAATGADHVADLAHRSSRRRAGGTVAAGAL
jgi:hypothetical protein